MSRCISKCRVPALFFLVVLLLLSAYSLAAQDAPPGEPTVIVVTSEPFEVSFGSGSFDLLSPTVGLADLASYRATLTVSFEGTNAGQTARWLRTYSLLVTQTPPARQLTMETSEDAAAAQVYIAEIANTSYERRDDGCSVSPTETASALAKTWDLAGFLDSVIGAEQAGTETVNDVAATHYTFDESAQGMSGIADSAGELWVALDGGYLVRYTLTTTGSGDLFGEGIEGTQTWDYELTDVNQPLAIELPADCLPSLLDIPLMPDATDAVQMPGFITFTTSSSLEDTIAFYEEAVAALGGQPASPPVMSETTGIFGFIWGDQPVLLIASNDGADTSVQIQGLNDPSGLAFAEEVPDRAGQTAANSQLDPCAVARLPMLPDASNVQNMFGNISYDTQSSIADAVAFYEEQLATLGGPVLSPMPATDQTAMLNLASGAQVVSIMFNRAGGVTRVSITSISMNQSGPPLADCDMTDQGTSGETDTAAAECGPDDILMLPDATSVQEMGSVISYTTSLSVEEAVTFYEEQIPALGGVVSSPMPASDALAMLDVRQGDLSLLITITSMGGANNVTITSGTGSALPALSGCVVPR